MANDDEYFDDVSASLFESRYGDDTPPIMSNVPEPPPSHWGVTTSAARTASPQYIEFLNRHREKMKDG